MADTVDFNPGELPEGLVVIKFGADWCGPCKVLEPQFAKLDYKGIQLASLDITENEDWATQYGIRNIPTTLGFKNGEVVFRVSGNNIELIKKEIEANL